MYLPVNRLNLNTIPVLANKEGWTGPYARWFLPFLTQGYLFQSGQQFTFLNSTIAQDRSMLFSGTKKPNTFQKDCCSCLT